jgi:RNA polymerase sigma factor (sigma-70 family)
MFNKARRSEEEYWSSVYDVVTHQTRKIAGSRGVGRDHIEDLANGVFLSLYKTREFKNLMKSGDEKGVEKYITTSVSNAVTGLNGKAARDAEFIKRLALQPRTEHYEMRVPDEALRGALATLTAPQRKVIVRHIVEGESFVHISKALGLSPSTVKSHYAAAIKKLERHLTQSRTDKEATHESP